MKENGANAPFSRFFMSFCYEKTEPLAVDYYSFGLCFSILRHSATPSGSFYLA
jgi:hypothetical protein